ncbi:MAG: ThiF family adenylyltransferase [Clostridiales bacterium]|jgi:molybdopterin/thiamine biosynthesis adenylyltransferase|nr:ThiF family adenylyltransferase [Clostridiales bacterium]
MHKEPCSIRFKNGELDDLRTRLLVDLKHEQFAVLLGKTEDAGGVKIVTVREAIYPSQRDIEESSIASLRINKIFVAETLHQIKDRLDVDTYIEVHTHPFSTGHTAFSGIDDSDERRFSDYIAKKWPGIEYASVVLSQNMYDALLWRCGERCYIEATIKTQLTCEAIYKNHDQDDTVIDSEQSDIFNRGILALGLANMRKIMSGQTIAVVGVGGIGSIIAENLVHMGFKHIILIDGDKLEMSNLNQVVGASYKDAQNNAYKVDAIANHLRGINPKCEADPYKISVHSHEAEIALAHADWIVVGTDNHSSRFRIQEYAFKYYVPFITAGLNISVEGDKITDISGEVITVRIVDTYCLSCLNRVNYDAVAGETHPDPAVREGLVKRGYISGKEIKEPAVKTLNSIVADMAVDSLIYCFSYKIALFGA